MGGLCGIFAGESLLYWRHNRAGQQEKSLLRQHPGRVGYTLIGELIRRKIYARTAHNGV